MEPRGENGGSQDHDAQGQDSGRRQEEKDAAFGAGDLQRREADAAEGSGAPYRKGRAETELEDALSSAEGPQIFTTVLAVCSNYLHDRIRAPKYTNEETRKTGSTVFPAFLSSSCLGHCNPLNSY